MPSQLRLAGGSILALALACTPGRATDEDDERLRDDVVEAIAEPGESTAPQQLAPRDVGPGQTLLWRSPFYDEPLPWVRLWGVTADGSTAWVASSNTGRAQLTPELAWSVEEIDLVNGRVRDRWRVTVGEAATETKLTYGTLWPLVSSQDDLLRVLEIARQTGDDPVGPPVTTSPTGGRFIHHAYGTDRSMGDWLMLRDQLGGDARRLDQGMLASYNPAFSPDGRKVAYTACRHGDGAEGAGPYSVYVHTLDVGVRELPGLGHASAIWWSPEGDALLLLAPDRRERYCLRRHELASGRTRDLSCDDGLRDARALPDDARRRAVFSGFRGVPGEQTQIYRYLDTDTGALIVDRELHRGTVADKLRDDGLLLAHAQRRT
ncbi:MAG: PD40 domain-containing protein, partial [Myxococcales bacterium]|nr:PD40 domain-containing protein [Myxococcales bacterium]